MAELVLYHNPRCSKSREALALLEARGATLRIVDYLDAPPALDELRRLATGVDGGARALLRDGEPEFTDLGLGDPALGDETLLAALAAHPRLLQRPLLARAGRVVIGRPPERVLALLD